MAIIADQAICPRQKLLQAERRHLQARCGMAQRNTIRHDNGSLVCSY
jgi:hypothetical protein